jgi:hypothetical protein
MGTQINQTAGLAIAQKENAIRRISSAVENNVNFKEGMLFSNQGSRKWRNGKSNDV